MLTSTDATRSLSSFPWTENSGESESSSDIESSTPIAGLSTLEGINQTMSSINKGR